MTQPYNICPFKLNETYDTLYNLQQKLGIDDEYLHSTTCNSEMDENHREPLKRLLEASKITRDHLITWHTKQSLVELTVTISLLTAKIKFMEYKLGQCEGVDLHQACSLSLVNFCNILSDMTILNVKPTERKTMHMVSNDAGVPIWLSHYRNQICHVPSESPCISILAPLILKALAYMKDTFWSKVLERDAFDVKRYRKTMVAISSYTNITSIYHSLCSKERNGPEKMGKRRAKLAKDDYSACLKRCALLRKQLVQHPAHAMEVLVDYMIHHRPSERSRNCALLLEQVILARRFECFVNRLLVYAEERGQNKIILSWLVRVITLASCTKKDSIRQTLKKMDLWVSAKMVRLIDIPPIKCCHMAHRLMKLEHPIVRKLIIRMRHKLLPLLGKKRTLLLIELTKIARA